MEHLKVCKSFFEAMAVLASKGKVRNENWSKDALYVSLEPLLNYPVAVFHKKIAEVNSQPVIERIGWSPSLSDFCGEWEIVEEAKEPIEDTFGYAVSKLFEENKFLAIKHKNWSGNKIITLETRTYTRMNEFKNPSVEQGRYYFLFLQDLDNYEDYYYIPTIPDILRKGWILLEDY
ncbi:hypothetical protein [Persephonella sp. KM09-Lau-8]|uniref:hypothetical protein n=1 Tax=Persephonella sp. KM09-Lau-8 TaxID=1158345 RepID=UPI000496D930|nr:hypothetical protein [Persephonella sp. KM09-Lau-8]